ncbi:MAG TPA: maleylacetoacetate isomerase [Anaeromyxobacteraceae bacterium]|nr:maleylacetoacetate isomerase [Anaeromyxobacteraceae bacterium]
MRMALYSYWHSSSAWRVRIALNLKAIAFEYRAVDLSRGAQFSLEHRARNPSSKVPVLEVEEDGRVHHLAESLPIVEWLEERFPAHPLLPADAYGRARVRALAEYVNAGIQPYQNGPALKWLKGQRDGMELEWVRHFITAGLAALEAAVQPGAGRYCHGDAVTLADLWLVPQLSGARGRGVDLRPYPTLTRIEAACRELDAFRRADPEAQPDTPQAA